MMRFCLSLISFLGSKVVPVELADQLRQSLTSSDCRRCAGLLRMSLFKALFTTGSLVLHLEAKCNTLVTWSRGSIRGGYPFMFISPSDIKN